jgi:uncharacterized MnhB-related membrane protein
MELNSEMNTGKIIDYIVIVILCVGALLNTENWNLLSYVVNNGHILVAISLLLIKRRVIKRIVQKYKKK